MLLVQQRQALAFKPVNFVAQGFKDDISLCDDVLFGYINPKPRNVARNVARRTNRIIAEEPPSAKPKFAFTKRADKGKKKAGSGGGAGDGDGDSDDEGRRRRKGDDDG